MWGIITWVVVGGLAGWVASMIMKTNAEQGLLGNIIAGVLGALVGGFIVGLFGGTGFTGFDLRSFLVSILGAVVVIWLWKLVAGGRSAG